MNGRTAKLLRTRSRFKMYDWYASILELGQAKELTLRNVLEWTPKVHYYKIPDTLTVKVSEHTQRWFYLQEKKNYARRRQHSN